VGVGLVEAPPRIPNRPRGVPESRRNGTNRLARSCVPGICGSMANRLAGFPSPRYQQTSSKLKVAALGQLRSSCPWGMGQWQGPIPRGLAVRLRLTAKRAAIPFLLGLPGSGRRHPGALDQPQSRIGPGGRLGHPRPSPVGRPAGPPWRRQTRAGRAGRRGSLPDSGEATPESGPDRRTGG
jgi:hypothetical protein